jgi:hypothetical protein
MMFNKPLQSKYPSHSECLPSDWPVNEVDSESVRVTPASVTAYRLSFQSKYPSHSECLPSDWPVNEVDS